MKWLVLGANGLLGSAVVKELTDGGQEVRGLTRKDFDFSQQVDWSRLADFVAESEIVVNCAGYSNVDKAEVDRAVATLVNAGLPEQLAEICRVAGKRLIQISSNYVFDGEQAEPFRIDDLPNPIQHYGLTKLRAESALAVQAVAGLKVAVVRTGWLYGFPADSTGEDLPNRIAAKLISGEIVRASRRQGAPTYARELAEFIVRLGQAQAHDFIGTHHAIASGATTWYEFAQKIADEIGVARSLVQPIDSEGESADRVPRPANGLLVPSDIHGRMIEDWAIGWESYVPELRKKWGR